MEGVIINEPASRVTCVIDSYRIKPLRHRTPILALAGRWTRIVMVLLLNDLAICNTKCVEHIKCLSVREANFSLTGNSVGIACVVTQELKAADCR